MSTVAPNFKIWAQRNFEHLPSPCIIECPDFASYAVTETSLAIDEVRSVISLKFRYYLDLRIRISAYQQVYLVDDYLATWSAEQEFMFPPRNFQNTV
ncbi:hypothetical protein CAOG_009418 [Capsaspora owczarzaki ATCC 30864]|uniref:Uncharacterized protein n=1 Tax=Capsaspora owczarzaki (strain ATCC 30864) TaxID=595528 RepID=A0A0D2WJ10_CAPO3|nr:hypothetical protein CAOG_009418 [Capsaspora owczarzaki ATCC 30864]